MPAIVTGNWRLDEGQGQVAGDLTGNRNNGQLTPDQNNLFPLWTGGRRPCSTGLQFNGANFVHVASAPTLAVLETPTVTAEAWVRSCDPGIERYILAKGGDQCIAASYALYSGSNGGLVFYVYQGNSSSSFSPDAGTALWDGTWHHVAGTYDGNTVMLYVDGNPIGSGTPAQLEIAYNLPFKEFYIGTYIGDTCQLGFKGTIAEVRVWNSALSASEILTRAQGFEL